MNSSPLKHPVFRCLFMAQICSLLGIGLMTMGLALLAYELGGAAGAGKVLGAIFALKMVVYVVLAPLAEVALARFEPRRVLVALDCVRLVILLMLGFATELMHLAVLTFVFYSASAAFTPLYQAMIPAVLKDEKTYTAALVLSRLAYTFESMFSPLLAALALALLDAQWLFPLAALCLASSVAALMLSGLSASTVVSKRPFSQRLTKGLKIYFLTPRLRGLFVLNLGLSLGLSWVLVNTVVYAGLHFDNSQYYTYLMAAYGAGTAVGTLSVPRLLNRFTERQLMLSGSSLFGLLAFLIFLVLPLPALLMLWAGFGAASSLVLTPGGLVLTRSAKSEDHPAVFAAQFSMSHAGWLLAYPLAGWLGSVMAPEQALGILACLCLLVSFLGARIWPVNDPLERLHRHPDLPPGHQHLSAELATGGLREHSHVFHIDELHLRWNP